MPASKKGEATLHTCTLRFNNFKIETDGTETVVARDHGASGILHPAVEEIAASAGKLFDEFPHAPPRAIAEAFGLEPVPGNENLPLAHVTSVLNRVFIKRGKILIAGLSHNGNLHIHIHSALSWRLYGASASTKPGKRLPKATGLPFSMKQ